MRQRLLLVLGTLAVGAIAILTFAESSIADPDIWGLMAMGRETLLRGWPPTQDPFTYLPARNPVVYHEWMSGVLFYVLLTYLGGPALKVLMIALGLLTLGLAAVAGRRLGGSYFSLLVVLVMVLISIQLGYISVVRAEAFTFLSFALFIFLLEEAEHGRPLGLLLIPPVTVVWANLHGGFVAGIGLVLLYIASQFLKRPKPWRHIGICVGTCVTATLATLLNPYGVAYWWYLREALLMPRPFIVEWRPLSLDLFSGLTLKALLLLAALAVISAPRRHWPGVIVMGVTAFLGFRQYRHSPFFSIACLVYLPVYLSLLLDRVVESLRARVAVRPLLATFLACAMLGWLTLAVVVRLTRFTSWQIQVPASVYPVGAIEFLRLNSLKGNLALPYNWGEYTLWKLYPKVKVSFDGRYETVYLPSASTDNFNFMYGQGDWRRLLREYPTQMVLVDKAYPMAPLMEKEPGWTVVYQDPVSALYLRSERSGGVWRVPVASDGTMP